jgi:hypothetical protein
MRNTKKVQIRNKLAAEKVYEPSYQGDVPISASLMIETFNWYHLNRNESDAIKYLKCDKSLVKKYITLAWAKRMIQRGFVFPEKESTTFKALSSQLETENNAAITAAKSVADAAVKDSSSSPVVSIQERIEAKSDYYIGELEGFVDQYGLNGSVKEMNAYQWMMASDVKPIHAQKIANHFKIQMKEIEAVSRGKDPELNEGYEGVPASRIKNILEVYRALVRDAEKVAQNQKIARKPRAKKPVTAEKLVSGLKYKLRDDEYKLQSVDPTKIVGAQQVWAFNTKTRKLAKYVAGDADGLSVKGTTLVNFSGDQSFEKTIRKPEAILDTIAKDGKVAIRKAMDSIKAVEGKVTGRINADVIILRII